MIDRILGFPSPFMIFNRLTLLSLFDTRISTNFMDVRVSGCVLVDAIKYFCYLRFYEKSCTLVKAVNSLASLILNVTLSLRQKCGNKSGKFILITSNCH